MSPLSASARFLLDAIAFLQSFDRCGHDGFAGIDSGKHVDLPIALTARSYCHALDRVALDTPDIGRVAFAYDGRCGQPHGRTSRHIFLLAPIIQETDLHTHVRQDSWIE